MGDRYYDFVVFFGRHPFWVSARATVLHLNRVPASGPFILASSHTSAFDVPLLMRHTPRRIDFVSITELFSRPLLAWFFGNMNAFPLERGRSDPRTVRVILERLAHGRVVGMFPEGRIRAERDSVLHGAPFRRGVGRIAQLANVPIVPAVVLGGAAYNRLSSWLPLRRVRYGLIFGELIQVSDETDAEAQLASSYTRLYAELLEAMGQAAAEVPAELPFDGRGEATQPASRKAIDC